MKVLFVTPHYPYDPFTLLLHPTLAYAYLAAALRQHGHDVAHADLPFMGNRIDALSNVLAMYQPDIVGVTAVAQNYRQALDIADSVKSWRSTVPVVMGGPHVTFIPEEVLQRHPSVDYIVLYDGEETFCSLVNGLMMGASPAQLAKVPALVFRDGQHLVHTPPLPARMDLDAYPRPDRSIFEMDKYLKHDYETVIMTARGCPSRCTFCSTTQIGRKYRWHGVMHVCDEVEDVLALGFSSIFFGDDTFSGNGERVIEFCQEVKRRGLRFHWTSNMRALDAKPRVLELMREAGAYRVFMGFESIQQNTLRLVKKGTTPERLYHTAQLVKSSDLELHASFIVGAPGDTHDSLRATLDFIRLIDPTVATFNVMEPRPGTDIYHNPAKYGLYIPNPYWYETSCWVDGPVCYTETLSQKEIGEWVSRCYDEFCNQNFRSPEVLKELAPFEALWQNSDYRKSPIVPYWPGEKN